MQKNKKNPLTSLHNSGLIKILICFELEQRHDNWLEFMKRNQFETLVSTPKSIRQAPTVIIDEVARTEAHKPSYLGSMEEAAQFIIKYRRKAKKCSTASTPKSKIRGKKQKREDSSSPSVEKDAQQNDMAKTVPQRYTRSIAR